MKAVATAGLNAVRCFAYGSNMSVARIRHRVPTARFVAVATLPGHRLEFRKNGKDGSAKCDAAATGKAEDRVIGVIYEIAVGDKPVLDRVEGLGAGYDEKQVELLAEHRAVFAWMYVATDLDPFLRPFGWYKQHVLVGARENRLPALYVGRIEGVAAIDDPDAARAERELAIYR